jgi:hypothetical protein
MSTPSIRLGHRFSEIGVTFDSRLWGCSGETTEVFERCTRRSGATDGSSINSLLVSTGFLKVGLDDRLALFEQAPLIATEDQCDLNTERVLRIPNVVVCQSCHRVYGLLVADTEPRHLAELSVELVVRIVLSAVVVVELAGTALHSACPAGNRAANDRVHRFVVAAAAAALRGQLIRRRW